MVSMEDSRAQSSAGERMHIESNRRFTISPGLMNGPYQFNGNNYQQQKQVPKQALQNYSDALYLPSYFSKNKAHFKDKVNKITPEFEVS